MICLMYKRIYHIMEIAYQKKAICVIGIDIDGRFSTLFSVTITNGDPILGTAKPAVMYCL